MQGVFWSLALLLALPALAAGAGVDSPDLEEVDGISELGVHVFAGMLETFLHRGRATAAEVHCVTSSVENVTHMAFKASVLRSKDVAAALSSLMSPTKTLAQAAVATADLLLLLPQLGESLGRLLDVFGSFLGPCVGGASRDALLAASRHLANLTYVSGRLQANGADLVRELANASEAFEDGRFGRFGQIVGTACRKVLLSNSSSPQLPEGAPSVAAVANLTAGMLRGFFGTGFELDITSGGARASAHAEGATDFEAFANLKALRPALLKTLEYFARQDLAAEDESEEALPDLLAAVTEDGPAALSRCGLGEEELEMLVSALEALGSMRMQLRLPRASAARALAAGPVAELQRAADDWKALGWFALGEDFGRMLLQLVVQAFPQKYSLGPAGSLSKRLGGPAAAAEPGLLGATSLLLLGLAGARSWRVLAARCGRGPPRDLEQGPGGAVE